MRLKYDNYYETVDMYTLCNKDILIIRRKIVVIILQYLGCILFFYVNKYLHTSVLLLLSRKISLLTNYDRRSEPYRTNDNHVSAKYSYFL